MNHLTASTTLAGWALALGVSVAAFGAAPQDTRPAATDLPAANEIISKAIDAMGGSEAFEKIESVHLMVTVTAKNQDSPSEFFAFGDDKRLVHQTYPGAGIMVTMAQNGDLGWVDAIGQIKKTPISRLPQLAQLTELYRNVPNMLTDFDTLETVERVTMGEQECFKIRLADPNKNAASNPKGDRFAFFSVETALLVASEAPQIKSPRKMAHAEYSEWKEFGSIKMLPDPR